MNPDFKDFLLIKTEAKECHETEIIQSLWSGYGKISRIKLTGAAFETVVIKHISLTQANAHPRGWNTDNSHNRKVKSYQVETNWYENYNQLCTDDCRTPQFLGSFSQAQDQWIVLEDLDTQFPARKQHLSLPEVKACLKWLANFHGTFINEKPEGLWEIGTYWHIATRPDELAQMQASDLKNKAKVIDEILNNCQYQTLVHGDAKVANFCFSNDGKSVAAVDFQYVGGGCGMKDVTYFLGSCLFGNECEKYETELLDFYFEALEIGCRDKFTSEEYKALEQEWRAMFPVASTDFTRFLLGWMPSHEKVNGYSLKLVEEVLEGL
ncbi:DUF1679 domain-containing protein [Brumimicrobium glaciale]|uniref:DUF1679 domain-containing protein n=1 Tax=Brumimicrobium glaciale TaxID=200475 RepID=A0A4Q4KJV8_9FLAO|nr:oxidoreductase family protein [Brumimicrobium glaciale]RYM33248.1 DUF1679 domain-containing protein [Brumimicrobium glaciale]